MAKKDSFSGLCSIVIAVDYLAGIEGENWDEKCRFACKVVLLKRFGVSGRWVQLSYYPCRLSARPWIVSRH